MLRSFCAFLIMLASPKPAMEDHFSEDPRLGNPAIKKLISGEKFLEIYRHLYYHPKIQAPPGKIDLVASGINTAEEL